MGSIKIHEIAKKLGLNSKEVLKKAQELGMEVKSHLSGVSEEQAQKIEGVLNSTTKKEDTKPKAPKEKKEVKKEKGPVIIRREVIISEEELKKQEEEKEKKKKEERAKQVGFVDQQRKKDFNIVYRNKPTKPLTVSELFGLKDTKKEEAKGEDKQIVEEKVPEVKQEENQTETKLQEEVKEENVEPVPKQVIKQEEATYSKPNISNRENRQNFQNRMQDTKMPYQNRENRQGYQNRDGRPNRDNNRPPFQNRGQNGNFRTQDRKTFLSEQRWKTTFPK